MSKVTITYRTKLVRAYYASIKNWGTLANRSQDECLTTLKDKLGYDSVKQLTDIALIEVLAIIQSRISQYV